MLLPNEQHQAQELMARFREERLDIIKAAFELFDQKAKSYDTAEPFWHRHMNVGSFLHELSKKVGRTCQVHEADPELFVEMPESAAYGESVLEQLGDIINYAVMLHWILTTGIEQSEAIDFERAGGPAGIADTLGFAAKGIQAAAARMPKPLAKEGNNG